MSDQAAAARILTALAAALDQPGGRYYAATVRDLIRVLDDDTAAALLAAARRETQPEPRVWLEEPTAPHSAPPAAGSGTVYPPAAQKSPHGASECRESASGSGATNPAERLRAAADLVDRTAGTAPADIWQLTHVRNCLHAWVALMAPDLAPPLAALLRDEADRVDWHAARGAPPPASTHPPIALADTIIRGEDR